MQPPLGRFVRGNPLGETCSAVAVGGPDEAV
jgi:hypothetical protein